jgi:hypothetical protein
MALIDGLKKAGQAASEGAAQGQCCVRPQVDACHGRRNPVNKAFEDRRGGRVAEGGGLLNRYTVQSRIMGSNPILSANQARFGQAPARLAGSVENHLQTIGRSIFCCDAQQLSGG